MGQGAEAPAGTPRGEACPRGLGRLRGAGLATAAGVSPGPGTRSELRAPGPSRHLEPRSRALVGETIPDRRAGSRGNRSVPLRRSKRAPSRVHDLPSVPSGLWSPSSRLHPGCPECSVTAPKSRARFGLTEVQALPPWHLLPRRGLGLFRRGVRIPEGTRSLSEPLRRGVSGFSPFDSPPKRRASGAVLGALAGAGAGDEARHRLTGAVRTLPGVRGRADRIGWTWAQAPPSPGPAVAGRALGQADFGGPRNPVLRPRAEGRLAPGPGSTPRCAPEPTFPRVPARRQFQKGRSSLRTTAW